MVRGGPGIHLHEIQSMVVVVQSLPRMSLELVDDAKVVVDLDFRALDPFGAGQVQRREQLRLGILELASPTSFHSTSIQLSQISHRTHGYILLDMYSVTT
jgi:hypothetical protein